VRLVLILINGALLKAAAAQIAASLLSSNAAPLSAAMAGPASQSKSFRRTYLQQHGAQRPKRFRPVAEATH
jgi:hypothetical protein